MYSGVPQSVYVRAPGSTTCKGPCDKITRHKSNAQDTLHDASVDHRKAELISESSKLSIQSSAADLGEPEVRQLRVAARLHQDVLRLQVAVDNVALVHVPEDHADDEPVEFRPRNTPLIERVRVP